MMMAATMMTARTMMTVRVSKFGNWKLRRGLRRSFSRCGLARDNVTPRVNQRQARAPRTPTCLLLERCGQTLTFGFYAALGRGFAIHYINFRWHRQSTLSTVVHWSLCQLFVKDTDSAKCKCNIEYHTPCGYLCNVRARRSSSWTS